jgi:tetratricopeptide (TPR) repeat protein
VQWVTAYRPQPRRWVKDGAGGIEAIVRDIEAGEFAAALSALAKAPKGEADVRVALLLADLDLYQGRLAEAAARLSPHAGDGRGEPMAGALLARVLMAAGRLAEAGRLLGTAVQRHGAHLEVWLSQAEYARLQGDVAGTRAAVAKVLAAEPKNAEAWYVLGRIETEREYAAAAREALARALALRPDGPGYRGELATLESFANEFPAAEAAFQEALAQQPDDYVALTGLGVLQMKRGDTEAALQSFLKAGVIEPRYARAALFTAVAYYQLGERARALEALQQASRLDEKDPLPHLMASLVHFDALELGRAIEAARAAQARMPFLKSLNQVLTDQKGNANVGSALAAFGMEEWAQAYAYDSYSPYWAGSHLFLADRFSGTYNKNSELFKGFLSDPSVFGASNRFSSLIPVPGHYASVEASANRDYFTQYGLNATLNGYSVANRPLSYFLSYEKTDGDSTINRTDADGRIRARGDNFTVGLGAKPTHELALFAFANKSAYDHARYRASDLAYDFTLDTRRLDAGLNYKFSPTNHAWLKFGDGSEKTPLAGTFVSQNFADTLNASALGTLFTFIPAGRLNAFRTEQSQRDYQWRQTFDVTPHWQLSWGAEYARQSEPFFMDFEFLTTSQISYRNRVNQDSRIESRDAYLSSRYGLSNVLDAQLDLFYQEVKSSFVTRLAPQVGPVSISVPALTGENTDRELNPRLGFRWRPAPAHTVRAAAQLWRKTAGVNTLAPVDTAGIPVDDQLPTAGGRLKRVRLQHEIQAGTATFAQWFVDIKEVDNPTAGGAGAIPDLEVVDLERLRARKRVYAVRQEFLEDSPKFGGGRVEQLGLAVNHLVSRTVTAAARYVYSETKNTTQRFRDREIPFHPRHYVNLALNWQPYARWVVGPTATYRSSRYGDEANLEPYSSGWGFGLQAYWESEDKRWSLVGAVDQLHSDKQSSIYRHPVVLIQAAYRH